MTPISLTPSRENDLLGGLERSFEAGRFALDPHPTPVRDREAYYYLVNIDEHPEVAPLAHDVVLECARMVEAGSAGLPRECMAFAERPGALPETVAYLADAGARFVRPWMRSEEHATRLQVLHYFTQYVPTALVDGCWLQGMLQVAMAHTPIGARLTAAYVCQVRAFVEDPGRHFVNDYRAVFERLGAPLEEVSSRSLVQRRDLHDFSFGLPTFLLSLARFPRTYLPEILGLHLCWQHLNLVAFGPTLIRDACAIYGLPTLGDDLATPEHLSRGRELAVAAVKGFLDEQDGDSRNEMWRRVCRGVGMAALAWSRWWDQAESSAPHGPPDPRREMIELLRRKAPHAHGYHRDKQIGGKRIDQHLDPDTLDAEAVLDALAASRFVKPGRSDRSALVRGLVNFGGPMLAVFSPVELQIIRNWIDSLGSPVAPGASSPIAPVTRAPPPPASGEPGRAVWSREALWRRSRERYAGCGVRDLYYYLVNNEFFPDIMPLAERFARDRLERSMASLRRGERPIPSEHYDPAALERWVYAKHRQQVDSYRPLDGAPRVSREAFIESTVQLAPLILIDGSWLQGMATPSIIHTVVGRMLFHVFYEEVGQGDAAEHHANIYRSLLAAMGEEAPSVDTMEFARWSRLKDSSFEVPTLWLSISCFPRHFLPEILGLNLAVELAGLGGPYMEAHDTLRYFRFPTLFVDVHNAADNISVGHAAWAMNAIKKYLDAVAEREGPHGLDFTWHRVWTGVRATLPQIGRVRLMAHRIARRFLGSGDAGRVPLIFPS